MPLLEVTNLKQHFTTKKGFLSEKTIIKAVDGVSISIEEGKTLGIVGESGCGKSSLGRSVLQLVEPTEGSVKFKGEEVIGMNAAQMKELRKEMQIVFQDPYASLNPRNTVRQILEAPLIIHNVGSRAERKEIVESLMDKIGLRKEQLRNYPHEFSGGQRQRIGIARALTLNPKLIIADEPVSALDVSVQSQVLNLMLDLQQEMDLSYMFISHDLSVVQHISDRVAVMYLGKVVEIADVEQLYNHPMHPYTQALLSALPIPDPTKKRDRIILQGDLPSPANPPSGCPFHTRCPIATKECAEIVPNLEEKSTNHLAACIHV
ncbi:dipeptide ABC transporter ATP-binding protein [Aquibacillus koreensis]|uniref:Dipeptide ABC transporter ATP-binding protein n=1 Tax=Aquibacillus koreensis TaxID=279446 RepID=A0A9X4AIZ2_9BACI|nr:dipeptide ABC transporter ATP-binding protein [Aquibacillus koreensis]MCT2537097.1 dipeptide ABC transporter ATP-binding protein [Aquibacillus koreensis]MDC3419920.1 dipeptide ABC transporter ATP-binding protein [Aquibacillus koreensis]